MILIAHRGESYDAPENTLAAINLAWERDADAVEVDVHLSKDDKIVVIHDNIPWKTTGIFKKIKELTLKELKQLDVASYKGEQWAKERIPTLEEVMETVPAGKSLFVEIKCGPEVLPALENVIHESNLHPQQIKLIGFDLDTMASAKQNLPLVEVFWVNNIKHYELIISWNPPLAEMINKAKQATLDGLDLSACKIIDGTFVNTIKAAGLKLYVWTVNDPGEAKRLIDAGVDGITSDRPHWLKTQLGIG